MNKFWAVIATLFGLLLVPSKVRANDFSTDFLSTYEISTSATTTVTHQIEIQNLTANVYVSEYSVKIGGTDVTDVRAFNDGGTLPVTIKPEQNLVNISVSFENQPVVGKDKKNQFTLQYKNGDIATITGKILELNIPKISNTNEFHSYELTIVVPRSFGAPQTMVPKADSFNETLRSTIIKFKKDQLNSGVTALFGNSQIFKANINYYLDNSTGRNIIKTIALIPDNTNQRVSYSSLNPPPLKIYTDKDGNWLADYEVESGKNLAINLMANIEIFIDSQVPVIEADPTLYLSPDKYWQTDDEQIQKLAKELKTPRAIYDFVVGKLKYNYQLAESGGSRAGAIQALQEPTNSICTEFTDLFVALARAAGIPAREINGFAYTKNPKLRPLSLSKDVLHSWPEYWDFGRKQWIQIDPTWGNTTGSIDYFNKLDLNHITFVTHGIVSDQPLPAGFYKTDVSQTKTVFIEPTNIQEPTRTKLDLVVQLPKKFPTFWESTILVSIRNDGNQAAYRLPLFVDTAYTMSESLPAKIDSLLPGQTVNFRLRAKPKNLWSREIEKLTITASDQIQTYETESEPITIFWPAVVIPILFVAVGAVGVTFKSRCVRFRRRK